MSPVVFPPVISNRCYVRRRIDPSEGEVRIHDLLEALDQVREELEDLDSVLRAMRREHPDLSLTIHSRG